jgi:hypothetical protein
MIGGHSMNNVYLPRSALYLGTVLLLAACVFPPSPAAQPALPTEQGTTKITLIPTPVVPAVAQENVTELSDTLTDTQRQLLAGLPSLGMAPELQNTTWFNSDPLQLATLRGKVVMVEFWTYG